MKRIFWDKRGFTTAELLVAALFGMIVIGTLYGFYRDQLFYLLAQETKTVTLEDARGALDMMVRELRNAGSFPVTTDASCVKDGSGNPLRVVSASDTSIHIQSDIQSTTGGDPDGKCTATGEDVTYALSGTSITRGGATHPLMSNVVTAGSNFLTYYNSSNVQLAASPKVTDIKRVKITFSVQVPEPTPEGKAAGRNITSTLTSSVEFRN